MINETDWIAGQMSDVDGGHYYDKFLGVLRIEKPAIL
jgi:hypothetical protein